MKGIEVIFLTGSNDIKPISMAITQRVNLAKLSRASFLARLSWGFHFVDLEDA